MSRLRLLLVEDDEGDAALVTRELTRGGYELVCTRVYDEEGMRAALLEGPWDAIVADHSMPRFNSLGALRLVQSLELDVPFVIVSGSIPEDLAVEVMKAGAHDFLTKDKLGRLVPVVERELREAGQRSRGRDAERRLRESEARYRRFFEDDLTGDVLWSSDGRVRDCNAAFVRIFGFESKPHAFRASMVALWPRPEEHEELLERLRVEGRVENFEGELRRLDGRPVAVVANIVADLSPARELTGIRGYFFDVTQRRELEEQLRHAQRMEAVGRLAGGVAHDFNNLLCAVSGYTQLALAQTPVEAPLHRYLQEVEKASDRATLLTRRLLAFSRKQVVQPEVLDVGAVVADLENMLRRLIREDIALELAIDRGVGPALVDRGHVEQVVMNLVVNARDAIERQGRIRIGIRGTGGDGPPHPDADVPDGRHVLLEVADDGIGMTPAVASHLFEPFFTTKAEGEGTGLGLSTIHGILLQAGGHIRFSTAPGRGTTFRAYWPIVDVPAPAARAARARAALAGGAETILVVEDNATVRGILVEVLRAQGYDVLEAGDGPAALDLARAHDGPIAALVSDVVMPQMHGPEVAERLRVARPGLRILFLSGYAHELAEGDDVARLDATLVAKPFHIEEFLARLRELLARTPGAPGAAPPAADPRAVR